MKNLENMELDEVGQMFMSIQETIYKIKKNKGLTDEDFGPLYDVLLGMPTRLRKLIEHSLDNHASLSEGDLVATECPKCGASLIDMDWDLLKVDGGALLCDGCDYAFTEPPKPLGRGN